MIKPFVLRDKLEALQFANNRDLKKEWQLLFGSVPPMQMSSPMMRRFIADELQTTELGGLTKREWKSLIAALKSKKSTKLKFMPGTQLMRDWQGATYKVTVTEKGFRWREKDWNSLSAVAKAITGTHCSGPRFFGASLGPGA